MFNYFFGNKSNTSVVASKPPSGKKPLFDILVAGEESAGRKSVKRKAFETNHYKISDYLVRYTYMDDVMKGGRNEVCKLII